MSGRTPSAPEPLVRPWRRFAIGAAASIAVIACTWWWLEQVDTRLPAVEHDLFVAVNAWPDWLRPVLWAPMQLGNFWVWLPASLVALAVWRRPEPAIEITLATVLAWILAKVVKAVVERERPSALITTAVVRDNGADGFGYVSGHACIAFALATAIAPWLGRRWLQVVAYALATVVATARIYVGAHLPLDVIAGAALGVLCGLVAQVAGGVPVVAGREPTERHADT